MCIHSCSQCFCRHEAQTVSADWAAFVAIESLVKADLHLHPLPISSPFVDALQKLTSIHEHDEQCICMTNVFMLLARWTVQYLWCLSS